MEIKPLTQNLSIGGQITFDDLPELAKAGYTDIVCNRPDEEHCSDQGSAAMARCASDLGLGFHYLPIRPGAPFEHASQGLVGLTSRSGVRVFAYCRSGARSTKAWDATQQQLAGSTAEPL